MKKNMKAIVLVALAAITYAGCKKEKEEDPDTASITENAMADAAFNDAANVSDEAESRNSNGISQSSDSVVLTSCATVTLNTSVTPNRLTIDFGTTYCLCKDGNYRKGKIYVDFTGAYRDSGSSHSISFDNYYLNYNNIQGTKTVTNKGRNSAGNLSFSIAVNGSIVWDAQFGGGTSTHTSTRIREWTAGETTFKWVDDVYLISGTSSGTTRNGGAYAMNTITPLRKRIGFKHFTDGIVDITPGGKSTRRINFGYINGAEDNLAQVTVNGSTFNIVLK